MECKNLFEHNLEKWAIIQHVSADLALTRAAWEHRHFDTTLAETALIDTGRTSAKADNKTATTTNAPARPGRIPVSPINSHHFGAYTLTCLARFAGGKSTPDRPCAKRASVLRVVSVDVDDIVGPKSGDRRRTMSAIAYWATWGVPPMHAAQKVAM